MRTIYGIDPGFEPQNLPPAVMAVLRLSGWHPRHTQFAGFDYTYVTLFDAERDAAWWQDGAEVSVSGHALAARYELSVDFRAVQHLPTGAQGSRDSINTISISGAALVMPGWFLCMEGHLSVLPGPFRLSIPTTGAPVRPMQTMPSLRPVSALGWRLIWRSGAALVWGSVSAPRS